MAKVLDFPARPKGEPGVTGEIVSRLGCAGCGTWLFTLIQTPRGDIQARCFTCGDYSDMRVEEVAGG